MEAYPIGTTQTITAPAPKAQPPAAAGRAGRMVSLDVFRGITIAAMILVNDPGSWDHVYPPLEHAEWNGWTPTDLIFPFFLFIVGVAMTLSFASRVARGWTRRTLALHVLRRSLVIFAVGLFLNGFPDFDFATIRIMGVLQRIALCYLVGGLLYLATFKRDPARERRVIAGGNVFAIGAATGALLILYWTLMTFVPVPGYGTGHLGKKDNLAAYVDRAVLGGHLWSESKTWDPEGILSTVPAIATLLIGILSGEWLRSDREAKRKAVALAAAGAMLLTAGRLLHPFFPINKNLWTSSFTLFTGGFALLALALCYWLIDVRGHRAWTVPWLVFGMNAILAYALAALVAEISIDFEFPDSHGQATTFHGWIYDRLFVPHASPASASLAFAIFFTFVIFLLLWPLYQKRVFLRI